MYHGAEEGRAGAVAEVGEEAEWQRQIEEQMHRYRQMREQRARDHAIRQTEAGP